MWISHVLLALCSLWIAPNCGNQVAVSYGNTCVLNGTDVYCWGDGTYGILGTGDTSNLYEPPTNPIDLGNGFTTEHINCGEYHCCGVSTNKTLKCWGRNIYGQLGQEDTNNRGDDPDEMSDDLLTVDLGSDFDVDQVACGWHYTCVLSMNHEIKCFGLNDRGQLGYENTDIIGDNENEMGDSLLAVNLGTAFVPEQVASGERHSCALSRNSQVKYWGSNAAGQLGQGDTMDRGDDTGEMGDNLFPIDLGTGFDASRVKSGAFHVCALSTDHDLKCWGHNSQGQLGLGDANHRGDNAEEMGDSLSVLNLGTDFIIEIHGGGGAHNLALSNNGTLKAWGYNIRGQLGYGDTNNRGDQEHEMGDYLDFIELGTGVTVHSIFTSCRTHHSCAILENATAFLGLKCWGFNEFGQLGLGPGNVDDRGDDSSEMDDELPFVFIFAALSAPLPTTAPTLEPTNPTTDPTYKPSVEPTNVPTTEPTTKPTKNPTIGPTKFPIADPTHNPTLEPTTKCGPYSNCTGCLNMNINGITWCLWQPVEQHCYFVAELGDHEEYGKSYELSCGDDDSDQSDHKNSSESSDNTLTIILVSFATMALCAAMMFIIRKKVLNNIGQEEGLQMVVDMYVQRKQIVKESKPDTMHKEIEQVEGAVSEGIPSTNSTGEVDVGDV